MYQLEERILFDGAAAVDLAAAQQEHQAQEAQAQAQPQAQPEANSVTGDQTQTQSPHEATPAIPVDTASPVPTSDIATADHSSTAISAPIDASNVISRRRDFFGEVYIRGTQVQWRKKTHHQLYLAKSVEEST